MGGRAGESVVEHEDRLINRPTLNRPTSGLRPQGSESKGRSCGYTRYGLQEYYLCWSKKGRVRVLNWCRPLAYTAPRMGWAGSLRQRSRSFPTRQSTDWGTFASQRLELIT
jgi:hypothetical protein